MNSDSQSKTGPLPLSGKIVGAVIEALDIKDEVLTSRTAKRYYSGVTVLDDSLRQVHVALGERLVELDIVPVPLIFQKYDVSMPIVAATSLARLARKWDCMCAVLQSRSGRVQDYPQLVEGLCRLVVIDLSLRIVAWLRLAKLPPAEPGIPQWAEENAGGKMLRALLSEAGITREQFAARLEVSHISIDNWFDGRWRPTPDHVEIMASTFSQLIPGAKKHSLRSQLQRQYTLACLLDILAESIGREAVIRLATALCRFVWLISKDLDAMNRSPIEQVAELEFEILQYGVDDPHAKTLLRNLASDEMDPEWRKDILASTTAWELRFQEIAANSALPGASAGLAQELPEEAREQSLTDGTDEDLRKLREASLLQGKDYVRIASGDFELMIEQLEDGLNDRQLIAKRHPLSPQAHMELGSYLGMAGKYLGNHDMITEGINECKIAAALCKDWDAPLVEPGIILINVKRYEEALVELENAAKKLAKPTPHLAMNRGFALMAIGQYEQALSDFELVIEAKPNYARALDYGAHCAFMLDDQKKAKRYAKEARKYGELHTYDNWRKGKYRNRENRLSSQPPELFA